MHLPTYRIAQTMAFVKPVVEHLPEQEITPGIHHEGWTHCTISRCSTMELSLAPNTTV